MKSVRRSPGWTRPSTVQTSRFSFFSREMILAFAPVRTYSSFVIESFHLKPNGGGMSSAAEAAETNANARQQNRQRMIIDLEAATAESVATLPLRLIGSTLVDGSALVMRLRQFRTRFFVKNFLNRE